MNYRSEETYTTTRNAWSFLPTYALTDRPVLLPFMTHQLGTRPAAAGTSDRSGAGLQPM